MATDWIYRVNNGETYTISQLAQEFEVTPRTIRFYEDQQLLSPRREGQNRVYNGRDKARLAWILRGKRVGFSLAEIGEMLDLYHLGDGREKQRAVTLRKCMERLGSLERQRDDLEATIEELKEFCDILEALQNGADVKDVKSSHQELFRRAQA